MKGLLKWAMYGSVSLLTVTAGQTLISAYRNKNPELDIFFSNFESSEIGKSFVASPLEDWKVSKGNLECLSSGKNRTVHLLGWQLGPQAGNFEMSVHLGILNPEISYQDHNWVGFRLGGNKTSNHSENLIYDQGIDVGVSTNGMLFIDRPGNNYKDEIVIEALKKEVDLKVLVVPDNGTYTIEVILLETDTDQVIGHISKNGIPPEDVEGDLFLVSNFENLDHSRTNHVKSVWFKNWKIKGTKLTKNKTNNEKL